MIAFTMRLKSKNGLITLNLVSILHLLNELLMFFGFFVICAIGVSLTCYKGVFVS